MRQHRFRMITALAIAVALILGACGDDNDSGDPDADGDGDAKGSLTVASFDFSESIILAHIYAGALEAEGYDTKVREGLGTREVVAPALETGEIDLYPGYAATDLEHFNKGAGEATGDASATVDKLNERIEPKGLLALEPSDAIDGNAIVVTEATAKKYELDKVSDLAEVADELTFGGPPECPTRPFCAAGLKETYGVEFEQFRPLDAGGPLTKAALEKGEIDVALLFSSDGAISAKGFVVLEDDKQLQNADNVVPIVRSESVDDGARDVLNRVSAELTTDDLIEMNKRADIDKEDPEVLAEEWLKDHDLS